MLKIFYSAAIVIAYIFIVLWFPNLRYIFPSVSIEISKIIISLIIVIALILFKQLAFVQLKPITWKKRLEWIKYPIAFAVLFFVVSFITYTAVLGYESLQFPTLQQIANNCLTLAGVVIFEEIISRAFLTNMLTRLWNDKESNKKFIIYFCGILFGVLHFFNYREFSYLSITQSVFASILGIYMCAAFVKTNSVFETIVLHIIFNFSAFINAMIFNTAAFNDKTSQIVSAITFTAILILSLPLLFITIKKLKPEN